ncbi:hypothetical protein KCU67_g109, partial [Aureobasidium melanogenum]
MSNRAWEQNDVQRSQAECVAPSHRQVVKLNVVKAVSIILDGSETASAAQGEFITSKSRSTHACEQGTI